MPSTPQLRRFTKVSQSGIGGHLANGLFHHGTHLAESVLTVAQPGDRSQRQKSGTLPPGDVNRARKRGRCFVGLFGSTPELQFTGKPVQLSFIKTLSGAVG
jgi:hypothetical protein